MSLKTIGFLCNVLSFLLGYAAAVLWYKSAAASVRHVDGVGTGNPEIVVNGNSFIASALVQAKWSKRAAAVAAAAAFFQACGMLAATYA